MRFLARLRILAVARILWEPICSCLLLALGIFAGNFLSGVTRRRRGEAIVFCGGSLLFTGKRRLIGEHSGRLEQNRGLGYGVLPEMSFNRLSRGRRSVN